MAKAAEIEVDPFEPYAQAAARVVRVRAGELFEHAEGVLDTEDIERVHAMRVATRRLRAVLEVFAPCFEPGLFKEVLREVKALADALGERRDPDVHIDAMTAFAGRVSATQRRGVLTYTAQLRERQAAGNVVLAAALEAAEGSDLAARLQALAATADAAAQPEPDADEEPEPEPVPALAELGENPPDAQDAA